MIKIITKYFILEKICSDASLCSPVPKFFFVSFSCFLFVELLVLFLYYFPDFNNCLSVFSYNSLRIFITIILNYLLGNSWISISLASFTENLLCSFGGIIFT